MADIFTQANRLISIETPLGPDTLLLRSFVGGEGISRLFHFHLDLASEDFNINFDRIVGQNVTISMYLADQITRRHFNGYISKFVQLPGQGRLARYQADMVPWLWFLTRSSDCRIFQNKSVPDIVKEIFQDFGFQDFEDQLQQSYQPWEYCVQYRETACNFVTRLLEQEGIYFFFRHEEDKHILVMADSPTAHKPCPQQSQARYEHVVGPGYAREEDVVFQWRIEQAMRPGKYAINDYNFETPGASLLSNVESSIDQGGNRRFEIYDYPGEYLKRAEGDALVRLRMEEQELPHSVVDGESNCRSFSSGFRFDLVEHERLDQNGQYVLTSVTHSAHSGSFYSEGVAEGSSYSNGFNCIPFSVPFRSPRITPKPMVQGPQTAVVVGPSGEEIYTDKYSRVKVQFHWDRLGEHNEKSSCWIRVSQPWAGKNWGGMWIPRIGQEVIVDFLEGDPDRPIITGRVYNAEEMPPYELPKYQTMSTMKSHSSKGGGGFNELRFEDKKDKEQVFIHSRKRMDVRVLGSLYETNHANRHVVVGWEKGTETGGNFEVLVQGDHDVHVKGGLFEGIDKKLNLTVKSDTVCDLQSDQATMVKANSELNARQVTIEALQKITLKVGSSFIVLDLTGVTIMGPLVRINSGGAASPTGPADIDDPLDASTSDTGEPGYLDKLPKGGGGGRRRRTLAGQHAPSVTLDGNGNYRIGRGVVVDGSDRNFAEFALADVALISTTPRGRQMLQNIDDSGRTVTIQRRPPNPADPLNAAASPGNNTWQDFANATPAGQPVYDGAGNRAPNNPDGTPMTGTGRGSDARVEYDPSVWPSPEGTPSDVILEHEMGHADHDANGTYDGSPHADCFDTNEEFNTIGPENEYRAQRDPPVHQRTNHKDL